MKNGILSKRIFFLVAIGLIVSVISTAVVHACSDLSALKAIAQAPCDHNGSQDEPRGKTDKNNCDSIRYGMLSKQASSSQTELFKLYSTPVYQALFASRSLPEVLPLFWRSLVYALSGLGVSPFLSHVVLRI